MKNILVCIVNYGDAHYQFLLKILDEYNSMCSFKIDVVILCTTEHDFPQYHNLNIRKELYDRSIGHLLPTKANKILADGIDRYDIFICMEDDFLITESNLADFSVTSEKLKKTSFVPGFLVYEKKGDDDYEYLIGLHPMHNIWRWGNGINMKLLFIKNLFIPAKIVEKNILSEMRFIFCQAIFTKDFTC
jgi:hypothetical protein